MKNINKLI